MCYIGNALGQSASDMFLNITSESYCIIGDDCLFSWGVVLESSDHHPIFDFKTHQCLNASKRNILIGDHIWVGQYAWVLKTLFWLQEVFWAQRGLRQKLIILIVQMLESQPSRREKVFFGMGR